MATQALVTAIRCLEAVAERGKAGLSELARDLDTPKATVLRTLNTLAELRWAQQHADATWSLTVHAHRVAAQGQRGSSLREIALPYLNGLQLDTQETVHLCQPDDGVLVVTERLDSPHPLRAFLALGTRIPLHASGTGLAYLAGLGDDEVRGVLAGPLEPRTEHSLHTADDVWEEVERIRERGYSINEEGLSTGITSLGAPLREPSGTVVAAISISGPSLRITPERFEEFGAAVRQCAEAISARL